MRATIRLFSVNPAYVAFTQLWGDIKHSLQNGAELEVEVRPAKRSLDANAKFHAICTDMAGAGFVWAGKARTTDEIKVLLVSGHAVATKLGAEVVPGLEGEFINIRESTAKMSKSRASSLIEYALAFCATKGIPLREMEPA
jgi:hypothetical protein